MPRAFLAMPLALLLLAAPAQADSAAAHVAAAKKSARLHRWPAALKEWQAAYRLNPDSDDLLGMGDAYAGMGDKDNARKQYNAYLADPLALDSDGAKSKLAALDSKGNDLDLGLDSSPPSKATASNDLGLDLAGPAPKPAQKKGKPVASNNDLGLDLDGPAVRPKPSNDALSLDLTPTSPSPVKKPPAKNELDDLDSLGGPPAKPAVAVAVAPPPPVAKPAPAADVMSLDFGAPPPAKPAVAVVASPPPAVVAPPPAAKPLPPPPAKTVLAVTTPPPTKTTPAAPPAAVSRQTAPPPNAVVATREPVVVEHNNRVIAYCTGALAIGALAVGGLYYTKASQNQTDLTAQVRSGSQQQALIEQQKTNKSLALAGIVTGVILAGVTTAIFVF
jgi:hypothetical protein